MQTLTGHNFGHAEESIEDLNEELALAIKREDFLGKFRFEAYCRVFRSNTPRHSTHINIFDTNHMLQEPML